MTNGLQSNDAASKLPLRGSPNERFLLFAALIAALWTMLIAGVAGVQAYSAETTARRRARTDARASFDRDVLFRKWASAHGGVYIPETETLRPNPYLQHPQRDLTTTGGAKLTLVNPAYMTRMVHELGAETGGVRSRIVSLNPINPKNAPDGWEAAALGTFKSGSDETSAVVDEAGEARFRFIKPFIVEESCLKCHALQGYRVGDVRGGISVSLPLAPFRREASSNAAFFIGAFALIWLAGMAIIVAAAFRIRAGIEARVATEALLRGMNERLSASGAGVQASGGPDKDPGRQLVERLAETQNRLIEREKTSALGLLVAGIAHELNTPLGSIASAAFSIDVLINRIMEDWSGGGLDMALPERALVADFVRACADSIARAGDDLPTASSRAHIEEFAVSRGVVLSQAVMAELADFPIDFGLEPFLPLFLNPRADRLLLAAAGIVAVMRCDALIALAVRKAARDVGALALYSAESLPSPEQCDARESLEAALSLFDPGLLEAVRIERDYPAALSVHVERNALVRAFYNFIKNALQAMRYRGLLRFSLKEEGGFVVVSVANEGPPIADEVQKNLFVPFYTTKKKGEATGLGLFLAKRIAERSGGSIAYSREGGMNVFSIRMPSFDSAADVDREDSVGRV